MVDRDPQSGPGYQATEETKQRWGGSQRARALIIIPFVVILLISIMNRDTSAAAVLIGVVLALGIVAFVIYRGQGRSGGAAGRTAEGVEWRGSASAQIDDIRASPRLGQFAPAGGVREAMTGGTGLANGTLTISREAVEWTPSRSARWANAQGWSLPLSEVTRAEIGAIPGAPSLGPLAKVNQGLRLHLADGSAVSFVLVMPRGLQEALANVGIAGAAGPRPITS